MAIDTFVHQRDTRPPILRMSVRVVNILSHYTNTKRMKTMIKLLLVIFGSFGIAAMYDLIKTMVDNHRELKNGKQ